MAVKKEGELRVRKGESVYGPMARDDFDRLLANGRFTSADFVSLWGGPWTQIAEFLSQAVEGESAGPADAATLRVLRGDRVYSGLNHRRLNQLRDDGRLAANDLVQAAGGPWMALGDFLSPPRPYEPPVAEAEPLEAEPVYAEPVYAEPVEDDWIDVPLRWYHVYASDLEDRASDQWFVRVRGIHSAPLTRQQVRQLLSAGEITLYDLARHRTWREDFWVPIHSVPELAAR
ncbi:MAG TPA: DUF4339 domain-containing protein [Pirellulales bacterium]|nr:DUF4339 domain-containing protein [Pirellulales bacterium]